MKPQNMPFKTLAVTFASKIGRLNRLRQPLIWAIRITLFAVCGVLAFLLRYDFDLSPRLLAQLYYSLPIWMIVKALSYRVFNLHRGVWRFVSIDDAIRIFWCNVIASSLSGALMYAVAPLGCPRSILFLDFVLTVLATMGNRIVARVLLDSIRTNKHNRPDKRVLIYGAGNAGVILLRELRSNASLCYRVCGFVDDNPRKLRARIQGVSVLGTGAHLPALVDKHQIGEVLIALPSATGKEMATILDRGQAAQVTCRTIPALSELIEGRGLALQIRDVAVEDLLGRVPTQLDAELIKANVSGKVVLVTGAAGSIGSELCHQLAHFSPAAIVGLDCAETPLFFAERAMMERFPAVRFHAEIGNILNRRRLEEILERYMPSIIYHAAAYKHVPMMEANIVEAFHNNVLGTYELARLTARFGIEEFVLISSDKAVRPTSVMGATKRLAELIVKALQSSIGATRFVTVRFGNVLGSNGSVIPLFKAQIAAGGPVTVTDPEMRRYFMTILEAAQLVLQAAAMGDGGETFVLDMGEAVRITDLAKNLIRLSGFQPDRDVKIQFTGIRPGEKLYEELHTDSEELVATRHPKIRIFLGGQSQSESIIAWVETLQSQCSNHHTVGLIEKAMELIPEYQPSPAILCRMSHEQLIAVTAGSR